MGPLWLRGNLESPNPRSDEINLNSIPVSD